MFAFNNVSDQRMVTANSGDHSGASAAAAAAVGVSSRPKYVSRSSQHGATASSPPPSSPPDSPPVVVDENSNESVSGPASPGGSSTSSGLSGESTSSLSSPPSSPPAPPVQIESAPTSSGVVGVTTPSAAVIAAVPGTINRLFRSSSTDLHHHHPSEPSTRVGHHYHHHHHHHHLPPSPLASNPPHPTTTSTSTTPIRNPVRTQHRQQLLPPMGPASFLFPPPLPEQGTPTVQRLIPPSDAHQRTRLEDHLLGCSRHPSPSSALAPPPPVPPTVSPHVSQHPLKPFTTPRTDPTVPPGHKEHGFNLVGHKYLLLDQLEGSHLQRCIDVQTQMEYVCKTVKNDPAGHAFLSAHMRVDGHPHINPVHEVLVGDASTYLIFPPCHVDLHSYVRTKRRLREPQARPLFRQIVAAVHEAHSKGIVLRDLKLRKFVFTDESRINLKLESLEDAVVLEEMDHDLLSDKHGCPAYVSPEILKRDAIYSGRAADMWGLGVMLYTMLVGRYPFHGQEHTGLFAKIRRGAFNIPDSISSRAKCLIRCLLRKEPEDRLSTEDVLAHPWVNQHSAPNSTSLLAASSTSSRSLAAMGAEGLAVSSSSSSSRSSSRRGHGSSAHHSTPMSVAPPSVAPAPGSASGQQPHMAPAMHPTLIAASAQLAAAAIAAAPAPIGVAGTGAAAATPMAVPLLASDYLGNAGDQTVPESIQMDYSIDNHNNKD